METTSPKPFVFVIMPFAKRFDNLYKLGIKPACEGAGAYAERVDDQIFNENILDRVYNQISKADVIVADMTGRNPNVFYEVGYAHALGKPVILLTSSPDDIPFDLKHYPHIFYDSDGISELIPKLETRVSFGIASPQVAAVRDDIDVFVDGSTLKSSCTLRLAAIHKRHCFSMRLAFNNCSSSFKKVAFKVGFLGPGDIGVEMRDLLPSFTQADSTVLSLAPQIFQILPSEWIALEPVFGRERLMEVGETFNLTLRVLREEAPPMDFPFAVEIAE